MNTDTVNRLKRLRSENPGTGLRHLLGPAKAEPKLDWHSHGNGYQSTQEVDGFTVKVTIEPDYDDPEMHAYGHFTDTWQEGAIQNPTWRPHMPGYDRVYRWWIPESGETIESMAEWLRHDHGRHEAWLLARKAMLEDLEYSVEPNGVNVIARAFKAGVELGMGVMGTSLTNDTFRTYGCWFDVDPYVEEIVSDVVAEAINEAKTALAELRKEP